MAFGHFLDDRPEEAVLLLEAALVLGPKPVKVMEQHPVKDGPLGMSRTIDSWHDPRRMNQETDQKRLQGPYPPEICRSRPGLPYKVSQPRLTKNEMAMTTELDHDPSTRSGCSWRSTDGNTGNTNKRSPSGSPHPAHQIRLISAQTWQAGFCDFPRR